MLFLFDLMSMPSWIALITRAIIAITRAIKLITESTLIKLTSFREEREDIASSLEIERTTATVMVILCGITSAKSL